MSLGDMILSIPSNMLFNNRDLYNLLVVLDLIRGAAPNNTLRQNAIAKVVYDETDCGAQI